MEMIFTTKGMFPLDELVVTEEIFENENEYSKYTEYRHNGELVKRAVHVTLKHGIGMEAQNG